MDYTNRPFAIGERAVKLSNSEFIICCSCVKQQMFVQC